MDKFQSMQIFVAVARASSFSGGARALGLSVPTVSRKVAELESALGVRLFERSTRQVALTGNAVTYFETCTRLLDDLKEADEAVAGEYRSPMGRLTVTAPQGFGRHHLQPVATGFLHTYPEIDLSLQLTDRVVNLVEDQIDLAVRIQVLPDSELIARPVGDIKMVVCASPSYLAAHGEPAHPSELEQHRCIIWSTLGPYKSWHFAEGGTERRFPVTIRVTTTTQESAVDAALEGLGLTRVTSYLAEPGVRLGTLVPVLRAFEAKPTSVSLVYPSNQRLPLKVRTFIDYAAPRLADRLTRVAQIL